MPRPVCWVRTIRSARKLVGAQPVPGWILRDAVDGRSTRAPAEAIRAASPRVPIWLTPPQNDARVIGLCLELHAGCMPGELETADTSYMLDEVDAYECVRISHRAYVVRRAQPARLQPHQADLAVEILAGRPRARIHVVLRVEPDSASSQKSRTCRLLRVGRIEDLRRERLVAWRRFGGPGAAPRWMAA